MKSKGVVIALVAVLVILLAALGVLGFFYLKSQRATPTPTASLPPSSTATETPRPTDTATPTLTPVPEGAVVISDTTKVLTGTTLLNLASISEDQSALTFSGTTEELAALQQGDVIVGGISDKTPDGFLRKVQSVTTEGGQVVVQTGDATLEEAIQSGSLSVSQELKPSDIEGGFVQPGVEIASASMAPLAAQDQYLWSISLDHVVLYDADGNKSTTGDQVWADGSLAFNLRLDFQADFDWGLKYLYLAGQADETADIRIGGNVKFSAKPAPFQVGTYVLESFEKKFGPLPLVIKPIVHVSVGIDGTASVGFEAGVKQVFHATAGIQYADKKWHPIAELIPPTFLPYPPKVTANMDAAASGVVEVGAKFFGESALTATISAHFEVHANLQESPPLRMGGGLRAVIDLYVKAFGRAWVDQHLTVIDLQVPIEVEQPVTDTPTPTSSPTSTYTPTPTATPTPTPTPKPAGCAFDAEGEFAAVWQKYKQPLGCPLTRQAAVFQDAEQPFERGRMFWRSDNLKIYVVVEGGTLDGTFTAFTDTWDESDPIYSCTVTPPAGRVQPWRGFGKVWCESGGEAAPIGWGLAEEKGHSAGNGDPMIQEFETGFVFRDSAGTGDHTVYVFFTTTGRFVHEAY